MKWVNFYLKWKTPIEEGLNNLLTDENLAKVGIKREEVAYIEPFFSFPGNLYTEPGVARPAHPCCGSGGVTLINNDGSRASIQDIFYYDYGHKLGELKDIPHWNQENRFIDVNGRVKKDPSKEDHIIKDTKWIELSFKNKDGKEVKQRIQR